jgi:HAD superfamily hydrolase (TIGR01549 family)
LLHNRKIKAVLFDFDGTLRHSQPSSEQTFFNIAVEMGASDTPQNRLEGLRWAHEYWAQSETMLSDFKAFDGLTREFWINYARRHLLAYGIMENRAEALAAEAYARMEALEKPQDVVLPQVYETLSHLKKEGYILGIVSNRTFSYLEKLETLKLNKLVSCALAAGELGLWKPDPGIFHKALELLDLTPDEVLFVGDNYYTDIVGSKSAGLRAILLDPEGVFPEPGCEVVACISEIRQLLDEKISQP